MYYGAIKKNLVLVHTKKKDWNKLRVYKKKVLYFTIII